MPRKANDDIKKETKDTKPKTSTKKVANTSAKKTTKSKTETTTKKVAKSNNKKNEKATKKTSTKKSTTKKENSIVEYYDLPYKYNKTMVKVLAQTPTTLFIYWEISDEDIENYKKEYGENFFETSKPVLIIHNNTLNYSFEVEINDFANSWYLHVDNSKSDYTIELGRRPIKYDENFKKDYLYITASNTIEAPNDHILFDHSQKMIYFKNVKTNKISSKDISTLSFIQNMGKIYNIYDLYKEIYQEMNLSSSEFK